MAPLLGSNNFRLRERLMTASSCHAGGDASLHAGADTGLGCMDELVVAAAGILMDCESDAEEDLEQRSPGGVNPPAIKTDNW